MTSRATARFWKLYSALPLRIQQLARKKYLLWRDEPGHPSLGFKPLEGGSGRRYSIRIGNHYRAIGQRIGNGIEWVWIGSHEDYNNL